MRTPNVRLPRMTRPSRTSNPTLPLVRNTPHTRPRKPAPETAIRLRCPRVPTATRQMNRRRRTMPDAWRPTEPKLPKHRRGLCGGPLTKLRSWPGPNIAPHRKPTRHPQALLSTPQGIRNTLGRNPSHATGYQPISRRPRCDVKPARQTRRSDAHLLRLNPTGHRLSPDQPTRQHPNPSRARLGRRLRCHENSQWAVF